MTKYFSTAEVAEICQVSRGSILRWIREGKLNASSTMGGHNRISEIDLVSALHKFNMPIPIELTTNKVVPHQPKVLIVDDDQDIRRLIRSVFKNHFPQFHVEEANNGFTAGYIVHAAQPEFVILDIRLPGVDGYEVCELIRANSSCDNAKIIAISAQGQEALGKMLQQGADDYLQKPFSALTLKTMINKHWMTMSTPFKENVA